jgi:hypothetical protein
MAVCLRSDVIGLENASIFTSPGSLDFSCSLKQAPGRAYSKHNAYDGAKREVEPAGIEQNLKGVTHILEFHGEAPGFAPIILRNRALRQRALASIDRAIPPCCLFQKSWETVRHDSRERRSAPWGAGHAASGRKHQLRD